MDKQTSMAKRSNSYWTETGGPEKRHWYNIFRPNRQKKKFLRDIIESNSRLTVALADQCHVLTILSGKNDDLFKQLQSATSDLTEANEARSQLKAKHSATKDSLLELRTKLDDTEQMWRDRTSALENKNRDLSRDKERLVTKIDGLEQNMHKCKEKLERLGDANIQLTNEREELIKKMRDAERDGLEGEFQYKLFEKETQLNSERSERTLQERNDLQRQIVEYRKLLFTTRREKHELEHELGCQNKALRYEATIATRELKKCKAKMSKMQETKEIIMSYYQDRILTHQQWTGCTVEEKTTTEAIDFCEDNQPRAILLNNDNKHIEYMQNKVLKLEGQSYNKSKLIEELVDIVTGHESNFSLQKHPHLKVYLDNILAANDDEVLTSDGPNQIDQGLFEQGDFAQLEQGDSVKHEQEDSAKQVLPYIVPISAFDVPHQVYVADSDSNMATQYSESSSTVTGAEAEDTASDVTSVMSFGSETFSTVSCSLILNM